MQATSIASSTTVRPKARHCHGLSRSVASVRYMSRWRVSTGRSVGSRGPPPSWWMMSRLPITRTKASKSAALPARRPRSMSVTNAGPPTAPNTRWRSPKTRSRAGFRACSSKRDGARATSSSTCAGSSRTIPAGPRAPSSWSMRAPAAAKRSSARAPRTCTPMSRRIVSAARWIVSTWSADRISTGGIVLTMRRHGRRGTPPVVRRVCRTRAWARDPDGPARQRLRSERTNRVVPTSMNRTNIPPMIARFVGRS